MRWRKQVTAETLPELEDAAERYFRPGTTYSIFSVREETPTGVFLSYRAEAHAAEQPGKYSTSRRPARRGSQGGTNAGEGTVGGARSGTSGPDVGPVTGRIVHPSAVGPAGGQAGGTAGSPAGGPAGGPRAGGTAGGPGGGLSGGAADVPGVRVPGGGPVTGYNPETVDEISGWRPEHIPAGVLAGGPDLNAAYKLLQDPDLDLPPEPAFATDDPEFVSLLDRAAPVQEESVTDEDPSTPVRSASALAAQGLSTWDRSAASTATAGMPINGVPTAGVPVISVPTTGSSRVDALHDPADRAGHAVLADSADSAEVVEPAARTGTPQRPTVVYIGLLDDPIEAAEKSGYRRWSAAGVLNGGQPGAKVVCYGLGDGSNASRLAEGLHRYQPMRLILAVDASRKHADTQAWVRQVAKVVQPSSLVSVARTVTSSPGTVQELGYPVQYLG